MRVIVADKLVGIRVKEVRRVGTGVKVTRKAVNAVRSILRENSPVDEINIVALFSSANTTGVRLVLIHFRRVAVDFFRGELSTVGRE